MTRARVQHTVVAVSAAVATLAMLVAAPVARGDEVLHADCRTGLGIFSSVWESTEDHDAMAAWAGATPAFAGTFHDVDENDDAVGSNTAVVLERAWQAGTLPIAYLQVDATAEEIALGLRDLDIRDWGQALRDWLARGEDRAVVLVPLPEMNGDWVPYGADPENFADAWRRLRQGILDAGVDSSRVRWAFAPNNVPSDGDPMAAFWPGADVVDVLGLSAFNFGTDLNEDGLFHDVHRALDEPLRELTALADLPVLLSEVGSSAVGGDREEWIDDLVHHATADPRILGAVWFNFDKEADFRVWDGDGDGSDAWRRGLSRTTTVTERPVDGLFDRAWQPPAFHRRHAGPDRVGTATALSGYAFDRADVAVIARADQYADALSGAPLARHLDAPLLLTDATTLRPEVRDELQRLGVSRVVLLGGEGAIDPAVEDALRGLGLDVERRGGRDRFDTAGLLADELPRPVDHVYVVEGSSPDPLRGWPDAVSIAGVAAFRGHPVLLTQRDALPAATSDALARLRPAAATIIGGENAVSAQVARALEARVPTVSRLSGPTRYDTSAVVADHAAEVGMDTHVVWLATGRNWPDALSAGAIVSRCVGILLLVDGESTGGSPATTTWLRDRAGTHVQLHVLGGEVAIRSSTADALVRVAGPS